MIIGNICLPRCRVQWCSAVIIALVLTGALLSSILAQDGWIVLDNRDGCVNLGGTWVATDDACITTSLSLTRQSLLIPTTVTVSIGETFFNNYESYPTELGPSYYTEEPLAGTVSISGTLASYGVGYNYGEVLNQGVFWIHGTFTHTVGYGLSCSFSLAFPETPWSCSRFPGQSELDNAGRMVLIGKLINLSEFDNRGELVIADESGSTIPKLPPDVGVAELPTYQVSHATAQLVSRGEMLNEGRIENLGTLFVQKVGAPDLALREPGVFTNRGLVANFAAFATDEQARLVNEDTISNTGVLVLEGDADNYGAIVGEGTIINHRKLLNVGYLEGQIYNGGKIINAGTIQGDILGPGTLLELTKHEYLPLVAAPGGP